MIHWTWRENSSENRAQSVKKKRLKKWNGDNYVTWFYIFIIIGILVYEIKVRLDNQYRCNRYHQSLICPNTRTIFSQTGLYLYLAYLSYITINRIVPFPIIPCASVSRWRIKYLNSNQISKIWCYVAKKKKKREKRKGERKKTSLTLYRKLAFQRFCLTLYSLVQDPSPLLRSCRRPCTWLMDTRAVNVLVNGGADYRAMAIWSLCRIMRGKKKKKEKKKFEI